MNVRAIASPTLWQERRLGRTILRTYRDTRDLYDVIPNERQPRMGPKEDLELQRQIEANEGIFEPLLVEPHPDLDGKFRIIDGDRRWTNSKVLVETQKKEAYRRIPVEITDRTLTDDERLRVWIYIHRQRKEWDAKEKEMVAYGLVDIVGRASAANILGVTVRDLDKLVDIYELSERLTNLAEPGASITWAREIKNINKNLLSPTILDTIVQKVNENEITNSKDIRKLRIVLSDPVAKQKFVDGAKLDAVLDDVLPSEQPQKGTLAGDIQQLTAALKRHPWTELMKNRGDANLLERVGEAEKLLRELKKALK
ncbi:MAG TPA: ParB N-terminal domain-containing protein [Thermoanaerobaculia bacterium]|nr:ParB N-terminal domain-containing protein [Thermoanaerobaculia bacterium]